MNDARTGRRAGVMTIVGDVGLGKSALLEHAIAAADHMRVLRCVGAPTEATLPFAGLSQMLAADNREFDEIVRGSEIELGASRIIAACRQSK